MRRTLLASAVLLAAAPAPAAEFPEGIDYAVQITSSVQHQSNPARLPDSSDQRRGAAVMLNSLGLAAQVPLLSRDTRLDVAASVGDARYSNNRQLDHQPRYLNVGLNWRAGRLFDGRVGFRHEEQLNDLNRTFPQRDIAKRQGMEAEAGLRVTESLRVPVLTLFQNTVRYDNEGNRQLYDRDETGWQVSAYHSGLGRSYAQAGLRHTGVDYIRRDSTQTALLDNAYDDDEAFINVQWDYSPKTLVGVRVGYLRRTYAHLDGRDTNLLTFNALAVWDYSVKTQLDLRLWRRPYAYDDNPTVLYATETGGRVAVRWRATPKLTVGLGVERTVQQQDTVSAGGGNEDVHTWRYGPRIEWAMQDNLRWVLDLYRDRETSPIAEDSYDQRFVRLGVQYTYGDHGSTLRQRLRSDECQYRRSEFDLC